jgi:hypothetical protein
MNATGNTTHPWPLLFKHHGTILGKGFLADIEIHGRLLATPEADGVWIDGVNPSAISLGAKTLNETHAELRNTLARIFIDFTEQTANFEEFEARVQAFFNETDSETQREWDAAVEAVRAGRTAGPDGIPRKDAETPCFVKITQKTVEAITPKDNTIVQQESQDAYYYAKAA